MPILKLTLTPINQIEFNISAENYGSEKSRLPFFDDLENSHLYTVLNALNAVTTKYSSQSNDREWMQNAGLLNSEDPNFYHPQMLEKIGQQLYQALFTGNIETALNQTLGNSEKLHIHIEYDFRTIQDSNLSLYPWHLVHDGNNFLGQNRVNFSYSVVHPNPLPSGKRKVDKLKVLVISSTAAEENQGKLNNQESLIKKSLQQLQSQGKADLLSWYESQQPTFKTLRNYLTTNQGNVEKNPDIIHFNGHGVFKKKCDNPVCPESGTNKIFFKKEFTDCQFCQTPLNQPTGFLLFADKEGKAEYISAERFADLIEICDPKPQLIVITACHGALAHKSDSVFNGIAQKLLQKVPAVVATLFSISQDSTTYFIEQFYQVLSNGKSSILEAVKLATNEMRYKAFEWYRPIIFLRHDGDNDGYLFEFEQISEDGGSRENEEVEMEISDIEILKDLLQRSGKITSNRIVRKNFCKSIGIKINDITTDNLDNLKDRLYNYDAISRLQEVQQQKQKDWSELSEEEKKAQLQIIEKYITLGPLGTAFLPSDKPRVLLIDEIDKSDIDLPNDLLGIFEEGRFKIPELERIKEEVPKVNVRTAYSDETEEPTKNDLKKEVENGIVNCTHFPFVILTSNGERDFPAPFLRRCLRLTMKKPSKDDLVKIVAAHLGGKPQANSKVDKLIDNFVSLQDEQTLAVDQLLNAIFMVAYGRGGISDKDTLIEKLLEDLGAVPEDE